MARKERSAAVHLRSRVRARRPQGRPWMICIIWHQSVLGLPRQGKPRFIKQEMTEIYKKVLSGPSPGLRTGLMWAKDADATRPQDWEDALAYCNALILGGHDDWRLPNVKELLSLTDFGKRDPALPGGHPFQNVQVQLLSFYGSSTTKHGNSAHAWHVSMRSGNVDSIGKGPFPILHVWPVRGAQ
jgi:uncharacterized protein DUF1566